MYNQALNTFVEVADCGSFSKASEKLFISPTAIMKQINQLEQHIGLSLMVRTSHGVRLTDAGKSIYNDAKGIMQYSREAIDRAYKAQKVGQAIIRVGTSALYPCKVLIDLWNAVSGQHPHFKLKVVPFEDTSTRVAFSNVGKKYDLMVGPHNSVNVAKTSNFLELGRYRFCLAMPRSHPLSSKKTLSYADLHGERFLMQAQGNSPINDKVRDDITKEHPEIRACLVSFQQQANKGEGKHLKRILQFAFTVFPKSSIFVEPGKGTLNNPSFWQNDKDMQFISLNDLNFSTRKLFDFIGKLFSRVASIRQKFFEQRQIIGYITIIINHVDCPASVRYIGSCDHNCMWKPKNINPNVQFYPRCFFPAS